MSGPAGEKSSLGKSSEGEALLASQNHFTSPVNAPEQKL